MAIKPGGELGKACLFRFLASLGNFIYRAGPCHFAEESMPTCFGCLVQGQGAMLSTSLTLESLLLVLGIVSLVNKSIGI